MCSKRPLPEAKAGGSVLGPNQRSSRCSKSSGCMRVRRRRSRGCVASRDRGARGADHAAEQAARTGAAKHADHGQPACLLDIGHETEKAEEGPSGPPSSAPMMVPVRVRRLRKRSLISEAAYRNRSRTTTLTPSTNSVRWRDSPARTLRNAAVRDECRASGSTASAAARNRARRPSVAVDTLPRVRKGQLA